MSPSPHWSQKTITQHCLPLENLSTPFPCMGTGKLPLRVAVNTGKSPLTPEKWLGYRVER